MQMSTLLLLLLLQSNLRVFTLWSLLRYILIILQLVVSVASLLVKFWLVFSSHCYLFCFFHSFPYKSLTNFGFGQWTAMFEASNVMKERMLFRNTQPGRLIPIYG